MLRKPWNPAGSLLTSSIVAAKDSLRETRLTTPLVSVGDAGIGNSGIELREAPLGTHRCAPPRIAELHRLIRPRCYRHFSRSARLQFHPAHHFAPERAGQFSGMDVGRRPDPALTRYGSPPSARRGSVFPRRALPPG